MSFMPHVHCYLGHPPLVWTMFVTDILIGLAYLVISLTLVKLARELKIPFTVIILCFGIFIAACGVTHFMEVWTLWHPDYWVAAAIKIITAIASVGTSFYLLKSQHSIRHIAESYRLSEERKAENEKLVEELESKVEVRTRALRESELKFRKFFESNIIGLMFYNLDGTIVDANDVFLKSMGYSRDDLNQKRLNWREMTPPEWEGVDAQAIIQLEKTGFSPQFEKEYFRKDGSRVPVMIGVSSFQKISGVEGIAYVLDMSEKKKVEKERDDLLKDLEIRVKERTKDLDSFTYSVSHDLRAPLRAIDGFSRILVEDYSKSLPEEAHEYLGLIRRSTQKMGQLIDDLLAFSRLGRQSLLIQSVNIADLFKQSIEEFASEIEKRTVQIQIEPLPPCIGDPIILKHVLTNLISNALKYTRQQKAARIEVGAKSDEKSGEITYFVKDNGVGFDMRYAEKLFGVFQRLHKAEDFEGTGVGLAIVKKIIDRHGGKLWADSKVNEGATFFFTLKKGSELGHGS